jgi:hypothetical protein
MMHLPFSEWNNMTKRPLGSKVKGTSYMFNPTLSLFPLYVRCRSPATHLGRIHILSLTPDAQILQIHWPSYDVYCASDLCVSLVLIPFQPS